ncbi:MAG: hypothetical protein NZS48_16675 [Gemmata sp.]|nr:hypothetical protein [Gemmata sp.]
MSSIATSPPPPAPSPSPRPVSKFEFNLLRITRFLLGHFPADQGLQLIRAAVPQPPCLSRNAVELVKDTLAKAMVLFLVRAGGWRNETFLRGSAPVPGRVWQRIPLEERILQLSQPVLEFLIWLTAEKVHDSKKAWDATPETLTPADELFFALAFDAIRHDPQLLPVLRRRAAFQRNPFCWLLAPGDLTAPENQPPQLPDFRPLFHEQRAVFLECLQRHLEQRWINHERTKGQISDWSKMRQVGHAEYATLRQYLEAADGARRHDLARFILRTNAAILSLNPTLAFWTGGLQGSGPPRLADRLETQRAALAVPRQMELLREWQARARVVAFFDDDYAASQLWKSEWEAVHGDRLVEQAQAVLATLEPLRGPGTTTRPHPGTDDAEMGSSTDRPE